MVRRPDVRPISQEGMPQMGQSPPRNGQRKPAQAQGDEKVPEETHDGVGGGEKSVPSYCDTESQRNRARTKKCTGLSLQSIMRRERI